MINSKKKQRVLLFADQDAPGIVARLADIVASNGGNITDSQQHSSSEGRFFLRFAYEGPDVSRQVRTAFPKSHFSCLNGRQKRVALFASEETHCLADILWRTETGQLNLEVTVIISNKEASKKEAERFGIPFYYVANNLERSREEAAILKALPKDLDFAVLARYMRILSGDFLQAAQIPFINVHHSFLPAFPGLDPYGQAYKKGVKVIGATAHYVIEELDAGAIISQRTERVDHTFSPEDLKRVGQEQERLVLVDAIRAHSEEKIIREAGRTVVFR